MKNLEQTRAAIHLEYTALTDLGRTGAIGQVVKLLDALIEDALLELATITTARLERKQGALAQLRALRAAIAEPGEHRTPKAA